MFTFNLVKLPEYDEVLDLYSTCNYKCNLGSSESIVVAKSDRTSVEEIRSMFGITMAEIVEEVTDDKSLPKDVRKTQQIEHAANSSRRAKLVKLVDKICNLRDLNISAPADRSQDRIKEYFDWANKVIANLRGISPDWEAAFDEEYSNKPK